MDYRSTLTNTQADQLLRLKHEKLQFHTVIYVLISEGKDEQEPICIMEIERYGKHWAFFLPVSFSPELRCER